MGGDWDTVTPIFLLINVNVIICIESGGTL